MYKNTTSFFATQRIQLGDCQINANKPPNHTEAQAKEMITAIEKATEGKHVNHSGRHGFHTYELEGRRTHATPDGINILDLLEFCAIENRWQEKHRTVQQQNTLTYNSSTN